MDEEKIEETIVENHQVSVAAQDNIEEEEGSIEKAPPPKKPRSEKQRKAFEKAQAALKAKREKDRELKAASKKTVIADAYLSTCCTNSICDTLLNSALLTN